MDKRSRLKIAAMQPGDIDSTLDILKEAALESWKYADFVLEIEREDSFVLVGKIENQVVCFCVARLIMKALFITDNFRHSLTFKGQKNTGSQEKIQDESEIECEIYNIAVKKEFQNQGVGKHLLRWLISLTVERNAESIWLEVRNSNKQAIDYYKKNDFRLIYERKNFYSNPVENALVMKRNL